jgi:hypothetical protein
MMPFKTLGWEPGRERAMADMPIAGFSEAAAGNQTLAVILSIC